MDNAIFRTMVLKTSLGLLSGKSKKTAHPNGITKSSKKSNQKHPQSILILNGNSLLRFNPLQIHQKPHPRIHQPPRRHLMKEPHHRVLQRNLPPSFTLPPPHNRLTREYQHPLLFVSFIPNYQAPHHASPAHLKLDLILPPRCDAIYPADAIALVEFEGLNMGRCEAPSIRPRRAEP